MSTTISSIVVKSIQRDGLISPGEKVVVAVSGGADSLCLLHVLNSLAPTLDFSLHVAHLNHGLRGLDARQDALFVEEIAQRWGLPFSGESADVSVVAAKPGVSLEEAARQVRYAFLVHVAARIGALTIAVGHNADDQAETVLMHWLRGAGLAGLRGMLPSTDLDMMRFDALLADERPSLPGVKLIRPLLRVTRAMIDTYCGHNQLRPRLDQSNQDMALHRNRLRHELLPYLETYNPRIRDVLLRSASVITEDYEALRLLLQNTWQRVAVSEDESVIQFDLWLWRELLPSMQRATIREAISRLRRDLRNIDLEPVDNAVRVGRELDTGSQATLPGGLVLTLDYDRLTIAKEGHRPPSPSLPLLRQTNLVLPVPGVGFLPGSEWQVEATLLTPDALPSGWQDNRDRFCAYFDFDALGRNLLLATRKPGQHLHPLGMGGRSSSISDLMINFKLPQEYRDRWPLLLKPSGVAWLVGYRQDEATQVRPATRAVLRVVFKPAQAVKGEMDHDMAVPNDAPSTDGF